MGKNNSAIITPVLAAGSTASPFYWLVNIMQRLCHKSCVESTPLFQPTFSVESFSAVGTNQYVAVVRVDGLIAYTPCDGNVCCTKTQKIGQTFTLPFTSATVPTSVTVTAGVPNNAIVGAMCQTCSRQFVSDIPLSLTIA